MNASGERGVIFLPGPAGEPRMALWTAPDFLPGDQEFLVDDPSRPLQLRPILVSEQVPWEKYGPSDRFLVVYRRAGEPDLRAHVRLKPCFRANTIRNVRRAIEKVEAGYGQECASLYWKALNSALQQRSSPGAK